MKEETYGWNLEMLMRVAAARLPALEIAVGQRRRIGGVSKVSGNLIAGIKAAWSISTTFVRLALELRDETLADDTMSGDQRVPARSPQATISRGDFRSAGPGGENTARYPPSPAS